MTFVCRVIGVASQSFARMNTRFTWRSERKSHIVFKDIRCQLNVKARWWSFDEMILISLCEKQGTGIKVWRKKKKKKELEKSWKGRAFSSTKQSDVIMVCEGIDMRQMSLEHNSTKMTTEALHLKSLSKSHHINTWKSQNQNWLSELSWSEKSKRKWRFRVKVKEIWNVTTIKNDVPFQEHGQSYRVWQYSMCEPEEKSTLR